MSNFKYKFEDAKENVKKKVKNAWNWIDENKWTIISFTPIILGTMSAAKTISNNHQKNVMAKTELRKRDYQIYDPSLGCYFDLKRPMTNSEKLILAYKPDNVKVSQVLDDLGLL